MFRQIYFFSADLWLNFQIVFNYLIFFSTKSGAVNAGKIVMYFAEWCGHCKRFKPHFKEAQQAAKTMYPNFGVVLNDCEGTQAERKACKDADVRGFPTVKIYDQYGKLKEEYSVVFLFRFSSFIG